LFAGGRVAAAVFDAIERISAMREVYDVAEKGRDHYSHAAAFGVVRTTYAGNKQMPLVLFSRVAK
jgi:hypothetical protein